MFPFSVWFDSGYIFCQSSEAWSFLSWCRGGFPWSCCSAHHGVSTAAVHHQGRHLPLRGAEAISHGLTVPADHRDSPIAVYGGRCPCCVVVHISCRDPETDSHGSVGPQSFPSPSTRWPMSLLCGPADSHVLLWRRQPRSHSCNSSYSCLDKVIYTPVVCNWWFRVQKTATVAQLQ